MAVVVDGAKPPSEQERARSHIIRKFDYQRDLQDLVEICANVYGGADYMPRIIHRIARDPGVLILAVETASGALQAPAKSPQLKQQQQQREGGAEHGGKHAGQEGPRPAAGGMGGCRSPGSCIDGIVCGERRGEAVWLYGLRVREGTRGRGLGHRLMEVICRQAPQYLAAAPDADPPPPKPPAATRPSSAPLAPFPQPPATTAPKLHLTASADPAPARNPAAACTSRSTAIPGGVAAAGPIRHITTCTVSHNPAAQRIIGRQLAGPLYEVELWPGQPLMDEFEAAAGWVRGVGLPAGAPNMLDWAPGVRTVLNSDAEAKALLPRWRRVNNDSELRSAVAHLLYGSRVGSGGGGTPCDGDAAAAAAARKGGASMREGPGALLWLPMPFDLWPLDSAFVQRELAGGNIWLLTEPACTAAAAAADVEEKGGAEGVVVGVMLLTHYETLSRVCAGILARSNAATHAAIAHAGTLQPHFWASTLRLSARPAADGCSGESSAWPPMPPSPSPSEGEEAQLRGDAGAGNEAGTPQKAGGQPTEPLPALYGAAGGHRRILMYGGPAPPSSPPLQACL